MTLNTSRRMRVCLLAVTLTSFFPVVQFANATELIYGVTRNQFLMTWKGDSPGNPLNAVAISGLQPNEVVLGMDFRPSTRDLYVLGSTNRLYTADTDTGALTMVGAGPFAVGLDGSAHGFDFDPVQDRIRIDTDTNNNYLVNPIDATLVQESDLFYALGDAHANLDPSVVHLAYANSIPEAASTQLYGIDTGLDILVTQDNVTGVLNTVAPLIIDMNDTGGFDISGQTGIAYLVTTQAGSSRSTLYTVDLQTGQTTSMGRIGGGSVITAMAVTPAVPEPSSLILAFLGVFGMFLAARQAR